MCRSFVFCWLEVNVICWLQEKVFCWVEVKAICWLAVKCFDYWGEWWYSYSVGIVCSKDFKNNPNKIANSTDLQNKNIYYKSKD